MTPRSTLFLLALGLAASPLAAGDAKPAAPHERTGQIRLHGASDRTFLFFTPEGERAWAGSGWDPQPVCSRNGRDEEGMVFHNGTTKPLWVVSRLDAAARVVEYVIVSGDVVTLLRCEVSGAGEKESVATVSYRWFPRSAAGEEKAAEHDRHFPQTLEHWQAAMNGVLAVEGK